MEIDSTGEENKNKRQVLIVTGLSGAGKNIVMRTLEDLGFYCVDNLPVPLLSTFLNFAFQTKANLCKVALGIDARGGQFLTDFMKEIKQLKESYDHVFSCKIIFLQSSVEVLVKRFGETRRPHPLASGISVTRAIKKEKKLLSPLRDSADVIIDTGNCTIHELRRLIQHSILDQKRRGIVINLISFGFKYGLPTESNLLYDLRFLPNPYFVPELKVLDGRDKAVQEYLFSKKVVEDYWKRFNDFLKYSVEQYFAEGRIFINVAIGCTGGRHRSVAFVDRLCVQPWENAHFLVAHRDIAKDSNHVANKEFLCKTNEKQLSE